MMNNTYAKTLAATGLLLFISACGEGASSEGGANSSEMEGRFSIQVSNGSGFNNESDRAEIEVATDSMFGFKARGWHLRVNPRGMPDTGKGETNEFGGNNTSISMHAEVDGERRRVGCDPADPEVGGFTRHELTDTTVSGEFTLEFVRCDDYFSGQSVAVPGLPLTVSGSFEGIPRTDQ
jgi:hypothetical protein